MLGKALIPRLPSPSLQGTDSATKGQEGIRLCGRVVYLGSGSVGFSWRHLSGLGIGWPDQWHLLSHHVAPVLWGQMADDASEADDTQTPKRVYPHTHTHACTCACTHICAQTDMHLHKQAHTHAHRLLTIKSPFSQQRGEQQIDLSPKIIYKVLIECQKVNLGKSGCIMIGAG